MWAVRNALEKGELAPFTFRAGRECPIFKHERMQDLQNVVLFRRSLLHRNGVFGDHSEHICTFSTHSIYSCSIPAFFPFSDKQVVSLLTVGGRIEEKFDVRKVSSLHGRESNSNNWIVLFE